MPLLAPVTMAIGCMSALLRLPWLTRALRGWPAESTGRLRRFCQPHRWLFGYRGEPVPLPRAGRAAVSGGGTVLTLGDHGFVEVRRDRVDRLLRRHVRGVDPQAHARHRRLE